MSEPVTEKMKRACIVREIGQRKRVYPRLISQGQMTPGFAAEQIRIMEAILEDYPPEPDAPDLFTPMVIA